MKKKIVIWGNDENDKKILVALELKAEENKVFIYTFGEEMATEEFYNKMLDDWRVGKELAFPEGFKTIERPLSMTEDLLPETIKVQRTDLISRAKTEWHFSVLSSKLYDLYNSELEELKDRIERLVDFDGGIWEELKSFWGKLSEQARERNLFREHAQKLKDQSNALFTQLKEMRTKATKELDKVSKERAAIIQTKLDEINAKVEKGLGLNPIFEELKKLQSEFRSQTFSRGDKNRLWKKIDDAFKIVKEKKFGKPSEMTDGRMSRLERRYQGLMDAFKKMQRSIDRDQKDIEFQTRRAGETDGQLEMQIRQAKVKMVEERITSKKEKMKEMEATKIDLEKRLEKEKLHKEKLDEKKEVNAKKAEIKAKIAQEISEKKEGVDAEKLKAAADAVNKKKKPKKAAGKETLLGAVMAVAGDAIEDVVDTVKAVSEVVGDKIEEKVEEVKDSLNIDEKMDAAKSSLADAKEKISDKAEDIKEKAAEIKEDVTEKASEIKEDVSAKVEDIKESADDIKADQKEEGAILKKGGMLAAAAAVGGAIMKEVVEKVGDLKEEVVESVGSIKEEVMEKVEEVKGNMSETSSSGTDESVADVAKRVGFEEE